MEEATATIATIISAIGDIITGVAGWFGDILGVFISNPLLLFAVLAPVAIGLFYFVIRIIKSFLGKRKI